MWLRMIKMIKCNTHDRFSFHSFRLLNIKRFMEIFIVESPQFEDIPDSKHFVSSVSENPIFIPNFEEETV